MAIILEINHGKFALESIEQVEKIMHQLTDLQPVENIQDPTGNWHIAESTTDSLLEITVKGLDPLTEQQGIDLKRATETPTP